MSTSTQPQTFLFPVYTNLVHGLSNRDRQKEVIEQMTRPNTLFGFNNPTVPKDGFETGYLDKKTAVLLASALQKANQDGRMVRVKGAMSYKALSGLLKRNGHAPVRCESLLAQLLEGKEEYLFNEVVERIAKTNPHITCVW